MTHPRPTIALPALAVALCALLTACGPSSTAGTRAAPTASPTSAAPCAVVASLPERTTITSATTQVRTALRSSPEGCARYARFEVRKDGEAVLLNRFDGTRTATWSLTAASGPGRYTTAFQWGYDRGLLTATGSGAGAMEAKYGTSLRTWRADRSRRAKAVRLSVRVRDYDASGWGPGAGRKVVFEQRHGTVWRAVASTRADGGGTAAVRIRSRHPGVWRAVVQEDDDAWGAASAAHRD